MNVETIDLGTFVEGEIPAPIKVTMADAVGNPLDISAGWTAIFQRTTSAGVASSNATISDGPNGEVTYVWQAVDMAGDGAFQGIIWVGNGVLRYASKRLVWRIEPGLGTAPVI